MSLGRLLHTAIFIAGLGMLLLSATQYWFALPMVNQGEVTAVEPRTVWVFKTAAVSIALAILGLMRGGLLRRRRPLRRAAIVLASCGLAGLLAFPYFATRADAQTGIRAAWLQSQHENLTWLGGDLSTSFEYRKQHQRTRTYVVDTPRALRIMPPPVWRAEQLGPSKCWELIEWTGYTNTYCQFVRRGWVLALAGLLCLAASTCTIGYRVRSCAVGLGLKTGGSCVAISCLACWVPVWVAALHVQAAADHTARGEYAASAQRLFAAADWFPPFAEDTHFVAQQGLLAYHTNDTNRRQFQALYEASLRERDGRYAQASQLHQELLRDELAPRSVRREACRAVMRSAVHALNRGAAEVAAEELQEVLDFEPAHLKAHYCLQLAAVQQNDRPRLEQTVAQVEQLYQFCQFPNKKVVLAEAQRQRLLLSLEAGEVQDAQAILREVR